jgi:hypothetical protein
MANRKPKARTQPVVQLPNAPLTEVVFELRSRLEGEDFKIDPGYYLLLDRFTKVVALL